MEAVSLADVISASVFFFLEAFHISSAAWVFTPAFGIINKKDERSPIYTMAAVILITLKKIAIHCIVLP